MHTAMTIELVEPDLCAVFMRVQNVHLFGEEHMLFDRKSLFGQLRRSDRIDPK